MYLTSQSVLDVLYPLDTEGQQNMPSQNMTRTSGKFWLLIILSCKNLRNSKCREKLFVNFSYLPKENSSKRNSTVLSLLPKSSTRGLTPITGEKTGSQHHTLTNFVTSYHTSHLFYKDPLIFPKNPLFSPKTPPYPFPY